MLQDRDGQVVEAHSASAGLDYPGIGPQLAALAEAGRLEVATATDREAVAAMKTTTRAEGILPALETAHAIAALPKILAGIEGGALPWGDEAVILLGFSGRGDKDLAALERFADVEPWDTGAMTIDELRAFCLSLPGTHEKETWGDAEHAGDVTFRVKDKIYVMTGPDGRGGASIRTTDRPAGGAARHVPGRVPVGAVRRPVRVGRRGPRRRRRRRSCAGSSRAPGAGRRRRPSSGRSTRPRA